jgi:hypothetical protein
MELETQTVSFVTNFGGDNVDSLVSGLVGVVR